ncbi:PLP-dependent aminotransferase family protein [Streptomyces sp. SCA2-2]|nr:PLP-dependent aminotransferase family protein [Streptomyces sp. SCA2-2]
MGRALGRRPHGADRPRQVHRAAGAVRPGPADRPGDAVTSAATVAAVPGRGHWVRGVVQDVAPPGVDDLAPGYLDPALLPVELLADAAVRALATYGPAALSYGENQGALRLRALLAERAADEPSPAGPEHVMLTAGTSQALHLIATTLARPGDVVLLDEASYDLAQRLFTDCGLLLRRLASDEGGTSVTALDEAARAVRAEGRRVAFLYATPTFHNPTGRTFSRTRREELLSVAARHGVLVVEDDAYAELLLDPGEPVPSMAGIAGHRGVLRLRTFAKTLAPGLRLGWLSGEPGLVGRLAAHGLVQSGGALNHTMSMVVTRLLEDGDYDRHLPVLRAGLRERRTALLKGLASQGACGWTATPSRGGFFLWLECAPGLPEEELLAKAFASRMRIAPGSRFGHAGPTAVRLSYAFNPPGLLERAGRRLAAHLHDPARHQEGRGSC